MENALWMLTIRLMQGVHFHCKGCQYTSYRQFRTVYDRIFLRTCFIFEKEQCDDFDYHSV